MSVKAYFDQMAEDERWLGWGYLGERARCEDADLVDRADVIVLEQTAGWTDEERFAWANSKLGRWAGDGLFGGVDTDTIVTRWHVFEKVAPVASRSGEQG